MADENKMEYTEKKPSEKPTVPRSATELQKLKLEKLMKDPVSSNSVSFVVEVVDVVESKILSSSVQLKSSHALQDKTLSIPDRPKQWKPSEAPEFIRFVMGRSSR